MDGASNARKAGIGIMLESLEGLKLECSLRMGFSASNNEPEYEALVAGPRAAIEPGAMELEVYSNSWMVVSQVEGSFERGILEWQNTRS